MSAVQTWEIDLILWFQDLAEWVNPLMQFFTELGYPLPYVALIPLLYWCVDSRLGQRFAVFMLFSVSINEVFKRMFHAPRPYWVDSRIRAMGMPQQDLVCHPDMPNSRRRGY